MKHSYFISRSSQLLVLLLCAFSPLLAGTITVKSLDDSGPGTLRQAVMMATPGDTILFSSSLNRRPISLFSVINVEKDLVILGGGQENTLLKCNKTERALSIRKGASVIVRDLSIFNGLEEIGGGLRVRASSSLLIERVSVYNCLAIGPRPSQGGGAIFNEGTLEIRDSRLYNNAATGSSGSGGGILNAIGGTLRISGTRIENNRANRAGGGIEDASGSPSMVSIMNSRIASNVVNNSPGNGGGIHIGSDGDVMVTNSTIDLNSAGAEGGGIWNGAGKLTVVNSLVRNNSAAGKNADQGGGGLYNNGGGTIVLRENVRVMNNKATGMAGSGGGILNNTGATLLITDSQVSGNEANRAGGGIEDASGAMSMFTVTNSKIDGNVVNNAPGNGGGIHIGGDGSLTLSGGTVNDNSAGAEGGGIWNGAGTLTLKGRARISSNVAMGDDADMGGGGLYNNGGGTITISEGVNISKNKATGMAGSGGGILNNTGATLTIMNSRIEANEANRAGGGIEDASGSSSNFTIVNTRIDRNRVFDAPGNGGGIHIGGDGSLTVTGGIVTGNTAGAEGGGIWNNLGTLSLSGTEVSYNVAMGDDADKGGGGLYNNGGGIIELNNVLVDRNRATGTSGSGGGILNNVGATLRVSDSRITSNEANRAGGGIEDASGAGSIFNVTNTYIGRNVVNVAPGNGGGIHIGADGDASVTNSTVDLNSAGAEGGGIWNGAGTLTVRNSLIRGNTAAGDDADQGGGGLYNNGMGTILLTENVRIMNNKATGTAGSGGGILNNMGATLRITNALITGNEANRAGGGIEDASGAESMFVVTDSKVDGNRVNNAPGNGGGIHVGGMGNLTISGGTVSNNSAGAEGGGLWNGRGTMSVANVALHGNVAMGDAANKGGGGLFNLGGTLLVSDSRIGGNRATGTSGSGGGLLSADGMVTVMKSTFTGNQAMRAGGAVEIIDGSYTSNYVDYKTNKAGSNPGNGGAFHVSGMMSTVEFDGGTVADNTATNEGGGIWNQAGTMMSIMNLNILGNTVTNKGTVDTRVAGAGVFNNGGILDIERTTIVNNRMTSNKFTGGGGIANNTGGTVTLTLSTISGNEGGLAGGGIINDGSFEIVNATIARNSALGGGGFAQATHAASVTVTGTIIAENQAKIAPDFGSVFGRTSSGGYNLIGDDKLNQFSEVGTDKENVFANLADLSNNGGSMLTHKPLCGSPAIDMGDPADRGSDQLGRPVFGLLRDIGSYERQSGCSNAPAALAMDAPRQTQRLDVAGELSVYPNPVSNGYLNVKLPESYTGDVILRITGMDGRVHNAGTIVATSYRLDLSGYAPGAYTLQALNGKEVRSVRFVVSR